VRELSSYVLVILTFILLRIQTHRFLSLKARREDESGNPLLPDHLSAEGNVMSFTKNSIPSRQKGAEDGKEDSNPRQYLKVEAELNDRKPLR